MLQDKRKIKENKKKKKLKNLNRIKFAFQMNLFFVHINNGDVFCLLIFPLCLCSVPTKWWNSQNGQDLMSLCVLIETTNEGNAYMQFYFPCASLNKENQVNLLHGDKFNRRAHLHYQSDTCVR